MHWLKGSPANYCNGKRTSVARRFFLVEIDIFITKNRSVRRSFYQTLNQNFYFTKTYQIGGHLLTLSVAWFSGYRFLNTLGNLNNQISVQLPEVPRHFWEPEQVKIQFSGQRFRNTLGNLNNQISVQWPEVPQHFWKPEQVRFSSVVRGSSTLLGTWTSQNSVQWSEVPQHFRESERVNSGQFENAAIPLKIVRYYWSLLVQQMEVVRSPGTL